MKKFNTFLQKVLSPGIAGTTAMTSYSYLISVAKDKNYKEPVLLGKMATRFCRLEEDRNKQWTGWVLHYLMGLLFAELYAPFWKTNDPSRNLKTGLVLGGINGFAAILLWKFAFAAHPLPPTVDFTGFAVVLFFAHLIFGIVAAGGYNLAVNRC